MMRKPKVVILGTGGTIAGKAGSNTEMTGYQAGEIGIQTLINAVPEMLEVADVTGEQFCNTWYRYAGRNSIFSKFNC